MEINQMETNFDVKFFAQIKYVWKATTSTVKKKGNLNFLKKIG